jgi:hypothetical protein
MPEDKPSLLRILQVDLAALLALTFLVVFWGYYLFHAVVLNTRMAALPAPLLTGTLAGLGTLLWRLKVIVDLFQRGQEAVAVVQDVGAWRTHLTLHLVYTVRGQCYAYAISLPPTLHARDIAQREEVIVLYDPDNPRRVLIKDLYL